MPPCLPGEWPAVKLGPEPENLAEVERVSGTRLSFLAGPPQSREAVLRAGAMQPESCQKLCDWQGCIPKAGLRLQALESGCAPPASVQDCVREGASEAGGQAPTCSVLL